MVWDVELGKLLKDSSMTDGIKSLAKIQGNDNNIGVGSKERGDSMKDGNKGSSGGPWSQ